MNSKTEDIWKEVVKILKNSTVLSKYIKEILEGTREDIPQFPCLILEPIREDETQHTSPQFKRIILQIAITCWVEVYQKDRQIIGDEGSVGIFDITRDVKNELSLYPDLNSKCIKTEFPTTVYTFEMYPYRSAEITMVIEFITQSTAR